MRRLLSLLLPPLLLGFLPSGQETAEIPLGLPAEIPGLDGSEQTRALVRLGERLFSDEDLSVDRSTSCASCHPPTHGFASPERFPTGAYGRKCARSAPALINRGLGKSFGWTGSLSTLEEVVLVVFDDPKEFDLPVEKALWRLAEDDEYAEMFEDAGDLDAETLSRALAAYLRSVLVGGSPVDRFRTGEVGGLSTAERQGMWIYESRGGCWRCHSGHGNFTDEGFHNTGVGVVDGVPEEGRFAHTGEEGDRGRFKTPTLRGLDLTAPYMHDGSMATLEEVVEHYRRGGGANPNLDPLLKPLDLTDEDAANLVAFLTSLSRS